MSKFKELKYVFEKKVNGQRRIYLNKEKMPTKIANDSATDCNHNINSNYKINIIINLKSLKRKEMFLIGSNILKFVNQHQQI